MVAPRSSVLIVMVISMASPYLRDYYKFASSFNYMKNKDLLKTVVDQGITWKFKYPPITQEPPKCSKPLDLFTRSPTRIFVNLMSSTLMM